MVEAKFFKKTKDGRITCTLCPRYCNLKDGQRGFCFVRQNINGTLYLIAYGKPYAVNVDPIEKKPLFHFLPGSTITSIGTAGCNMACSFCQNYDLSQAELNHQRAIDLPPERVIQMARYHKTESIAYTYNEPTIFVEYVMDTAKLGKKNHLKNVMVTNGYINSEAIEAVYQNIDGANVDLKACTE
jgi:pyruvate formate lyase activating enzyme